MSNDELLQFCSDDILSQCPEGDALPWLVLVVDDCPDVVEVTISILRQCQFLGRTIKVLTAASSAEARLILMSHPDIAVALIDVVMETDDAGLRLITMIREEFRMHAIRIILRTGQPGVAPEHEVINHYDINDYRLKTELTSHSLYTSVVASLRGYTEIIARIHAEQEAVLAARSKAQFLSSLSHELRTPLNAIIGFSEVLSYRWAREGAKTETELDYVTAIHDNGQQLLEVINDLLDIASLDAGHYNLREGEVVLDALLCSRKRLLAERAKEAGITLSHIPQACSVVILGDEVALAQVLDNLISNAIKFSGPGSAVELSGLIAEDGRPKIVIADHGIGIASARMRDLFIPFSQLDGGLTRHYDGIGVGLAIVKGLMQLHDGTVELASVEGEGTTVTLYLPAERLLSGG